MTESNATRPEVTGTLLPCPFCGGDAELFTDHDERSEALIAGHPINVFVKDEFHGVRCTRCDVGQTNPFVEAKYAITAWNHRTAAEASAKAEIAELRADKARLDWLQEEMNDVRWISGQATPVCSPSDEVGVRIVSHWQAKPRERVEAENWNENLRAAIDDARALLARDKDGESA